ncbi:MAG TPA: protein-glutamate O-methyltransferase CheR [Verrucomicrobiae bacterium]|nr:protein-glutamate O-methyltransferase CheR [Verrucomicrobiae bacterium]
MEAISDRNYDFIRQLLYEHSRINLGDAKKVLVSSRLAKRVRALGLGDFSEYCDLLKSADGGEELANLVDVMSTNHTHFFREPKHFDFLSSTVIPALLPELKRGREPLRVWSAACSSGEEPYSLAILLSELLASHGLEWRIDASDISRPVLAKAEQGVYPDDRLEQVRPDWLRRYFQKGVGNWKGHARVKQELRDRLRFHNLNLLQPGYPFTEKFHVIFCRNVMIYFDRPTQETLVSKLAGQLLPGGYLMVGHSESLSGIRHTLQSASPAIYRQAPADSY